MSGSTAGGREKRLSDSAALTAAGEGYLATLGLGFRASSKEVIRSYRRSALLLHPDKVGHASPAVVDKFQALNTAYTVMANEEARAKYMAMYRIRCHLYQQPHIDGNALAPFYVLHVKKPNPVGFMQKRVLTLDLLEGNLQNWKKDEPHRVIPLAHLREVRTTGPTSFTLAFTSGEREYKLAVDSPAVCELYTSVLRAICAKEVPMPVDDSNFPPPSLRKGFVEKAGKGGDWARRWLILGPANLLIFRDASCAQMVNAVPLDSTACEASLGMDGGWTLVAAGRRWSFRNSKSSIATAWVKAVSGALQQPTASYDWLRALPSLSTAQSDFLASSSADNDDSCASLPRPSASASVASGGAVEGRARGPSLIHTSHEWSAHLSMGEADDTPLLIDADLEEAANHSSEAADLIDEDEEEVEPMPPGPPLPPEQIPEEPSEEGLPAGPAEPPTEIASESTRSSSLGALSARVAGMFGSSSGSGKFNKTGSGKFLPPGREGAMDVSDADAEASPVEFEGKSPSTKFGKVPHANAVAEQLGRGHGMVRHFL